MSMDKWLNEEKNRKKRKDGEKKPQSKEKIEEIKKKKIKELLHKKTPVPDKISAKNEEWNNIEDEFLKYVLEFKEWINQRTYLKGDLNKIETWVKNLYAKLESNHQTETNEKNETPSREKLKQEYKLVPPDLIEESMRTAINKKLHNRKRTSSDNYYLRKLKLQIQDRLKEIKYYRILKQILDL